MSKSALVHHSVDPDFLVHSVAVFDVLSSSRRSGPFVLMQPRPPISDVLRGFDMSSAASLYDPDTAYVGLVEETGSLFVMGNEHFPLIAFGDTEYSINSRLIDPPSSAIPRKDLPDRVDAITKRRKLRELCAESPFDTRCLTGKRPLDASSLNSRQLPGVPSVELPPDIPLVQNNVINPPESRPDIPDTTNNSPTAIPSWSTVTGAIGESFSMSAAFVTILIAMVFGSVLLFKDKLSPSTLRLTSEIQSASIPTSITSQLTAAEVPPAPPSVPDGEIHDVTVLTPPLPSDTGSSPPMPVPDASDSVAQLHGSPTPTKEILDPLGAPAVDDAEESEREGDLTDATPRKRKAHRRRRGKKGKGNNSAAVGAVDDTEGEKDAEGVTGSKEDDGGNAGEENMKDPGSVTVVVQSTHQATAPSLIVSDTVLGKLDYPFYRECSWFYDG